MITARDNGQGKLEWLQCLRAFSLLVVLAYHVGSVIEIHIGDARLVHWFGFGHCGVDIFFVISGFILYRLHRSEFGKPENTGLYLKKRFFRIYPIYWIIITAVLLPALLIPDLIKAGKLTPLSILENYLLFPIHYSGLPIVPPAWSLFHEVKFYLFFALLIALPSPWHRIWMAAWCIGSIGTTAWIITAKPVFENFWHFFWMGPHNLMFLAGCLSGWLMARRSAVVFNGLVLVTAGAITLGIFAWLDVTDAISRLARMGGYAFSGFLLVTGCVKMDLNDTMSRRAPAWLVTLGDASYSAYLVHFPFLYIATKFVAATIGVVTAREHVMVIALLLVVSSLAMCFIVYQWVERPLNRKCRAWARLGAS